MSRESIKCFRFSATEFTATNFLHQKPLSEFLSSFMTDLLLPAENCFCPYGTLLLRYVLVMSCCVFGDFSSAELWTFSISGNIFSPQIIDVVGWAFSDCSGQVLISEKYESVWKAARSVCGNLLEFEFVGRAALRASTL